jgi:hypothetical protein
MSIPSISTATALSGAVGPLNTLYRQSMAQISNQRNPLARKFDCQLSTEGTGANNITAVRISIRIRPPAHLIFFIVIRISSLEYVHI